MDEFQYLDKRDENGLMLRYSARRLAKDVAEECVKKISQYSVYNTLIESLPNKCVEIYYKKLLYECFLPTAHKLVINKWHIENTGKPIIDKVNVIGFPSKELLELVLHSNTIVFENKTDLHQMRLNIKKYIKSVYHMFFKLKHTLVAKLYPLTNKKTIISSEQKNVIAINYVQGVAKDKRSDLFWLDNSGVKPSSVLVYFESSMMMTRHDQTDEGIRILKDYGVNCVKLWKWNNLKSVSPIDVLKNNIKNNRPVDPIEKWLCQASFTLLKKVEYWYSFFSDFKVRVHSDSIEYGVETIAKQVALIMLDGCSLGKMRSYPPTKKDCFFGYYNNDIFFAWGQHAAFRLINTDNIIDKTLLSGYPYHTRSEKIQKEVGIIKENFFSRGVKFIVLLLDSNHGSNKGLMQVVETSFMETFYQSFLNWLIDDEEIGLIIKSKKPDMLDNLPATKGLLHKIIDSGRCHVVDNPFQKISANYASIADISVATAFWFPSALMECVVTGSRGIFYDYSNTKSVETELYAWGENKVFFKDFDEMTAAMKSYKANPNSNPAFGDWSEHLDELDPYRDGRGGKRIGTYIRWLLESFDKGKSREEAIGNANKLFADEWGMDKVIDMGHNK